MAHFLARCVGHTFILAVCRTGDLCSIMFGRLVFKTGFACNAERNKNKKERKRKRKKEKEKKMVVKGEIGR